MDWKPSSLRLVVFVPVLLGTLAACGWLFQLQRIPHEIKVLFWLGAMICLLAFQHCLFREQHRLAWSKITQAMGVRQGQFSLLGLLLAVSLACGFFAYVRWETERALERHTGRQKIVAGAMEIVGKGKARFSGATHDVMVIVERKDFGDADLKRLIEYFDARLPPEGGIYFLSLEATSVTDQGLALLAQCHRLQYLCLDKTPVSDEGLQHVVGLPNLEAISATGTKVTDAWRNRMREERPKLQISR